MLREFESLPADILDCPAERLLEKLGGPTVISLPGRNPRPFFISVLLHGNETSGWNGLRRWLARQRTLPRSVTLFIGNVRAAAVNLRTLPDQQDYNRIWRTDDEPEATLVRDIRRIVDREPWLAAIDLHNNTGHNPHYTVLTDLRLDNLGLAQLFSDTAVLVSEPDTVMTRMFDGVCPAVTLELGPIADERSDDRCLAFLEKCFLLDEVPSARREDMNLYRALARVHVAEQADFGFTNGGGSVPPHTSSGPSLMLTGGVEGVNFHPLPAGFEFGSGSGDIETLLCVLDGEHRDVTRRYFELVDGRIRLTRPVTPAMYTTDPLVVRQDCLCYLMERMGALPAST